MKTNKKDRQNIKELFKEIYNITARFETNVGLIKFTKFYSNTNSDISY